MSSAGLLLCGFHAGFEGVAAAAYFSAMPAMLDGSKFNFRGRNRRPPEDPVNAVLSFLYTLLKNDVQSALEGRKGWTRRQGSCTHCAPAARLWHWT